MKYLRFVHPAHSAIHLSGMAYEIVVENPDHLEKGVKAMTVDGKPVSGSILSPVPAGSTVEVKVVMG